MPARTARFALVVNEQGLTITNASAAGARWVERVLGGIAAAVGTFLSAPNSGELELSSLVCIQEKEQFKSESFLPLAKSVLKQAKGFI